MIASAEICIQAGGEHVRQHAGQVPPTVDPTHEARMGISGGERKNVVHEFVMDGCQIGWFRRHILLEAGPHTVRNWLPYRTFADVLHIVEDVIEHPMPVRTQAVPIRRVETAIEFGPKFGRARRFHEVIK